MAKAGASTFGTKPTAIPTRGPGEVVLHQFVYLGESMKRDLTPAQLAQEVTVTLPLSAVLRLSETEPVMQLAQASARPAQIPNLPPIGETYLDGIYAGVTVRDDVPHVLILLPEEFNGPWEKAKAWAAEKGGELPTRIDQLVLFKNVKGEFKEAWYWSGEQYAGNDVYAWSQYFGNSTQYDYRKGNDYRARAVRSIPIRS